MAVAQPQLAPRDQEALKLIAERLAQGAPVKAILAELMQREPFSEWSSSGMRKQWVQVWRPALAGQGLLPAAIVKKMRSRTRGRAGRRSGAVAGDQGNGGEPATPSAPPAQPPAGGTGSPQAAPSVTAPAMAAVTPTGGGAPAQAPIPLASAQAPAALAPVSPAASAPGTASAQAGLTAQVAALREAVYPLARGALGLPLTPADLATLFAAATLALRQLEETALSLAQEHDRLKAEASGLRHQVQQQEAHLARWDALWRRQQETLALIHQAIAEGLQGEAGEDAAHLREVLQVVQNRVRQMLR